MVRAIHNFHDVPGCPDGHGTVSRSEVIRNFKEHVGYLVSKPFKTLFVMVTNNLVIWSSVEAHLDGRNTLSTPIPPDVTVAGKDNKSYLSKLSFVMVTNNLVYLSVL